MLLSPDALMTESESRKPDWDPGVQWGPLRLPSKSACLHFCAVGAPGSGKTVLLRLLMQSVLPLVGAADKSASFGPVSVARRAPVLAQAAPVLPMEDSRLPVSLIGIVGLVIIQPIFYWITVQPIKHDTDTYANSTFLSAVIVPLAMLIAASANRKRFAGWGATLMLAATFSLYLLANILLQLNNQSDSPFKFEARFNGLFAVGEPPYASEGDCAAVLVIHR